MKSGKKKHRNGLEFYKSKGKFWWRVYESGRIIDASTQGYSRLSQGAGENYISSHGESVRVIFDVGEAISEYKAKRYKK